MSGDCSWAAGSGCCWSAGAAAAGAVASSDLYASTARRLRPAYIIVKTAAEAVRTSTEQGAQSAMRWLRRPRVLALQFRHTQIGHYRQSTARMAVADLTAARGPRPRHRNAGTDLENADAGHGWKWMMGSGGGIRFAFIIWPMTVVARRHKSAAWRCSQCSMMMGRNAIFHRVSSGCMDRHPVCH